MTNATERACGQLGVPPFGRSTVCPAPSAKAELDPRVRAFLADSYPHNHNYRVVGQRLAPKCQLSLRYRRIAALYPRPLTSLLDLSSSQGYFVLAAAQEGTCQRALGIDVDPPSLAASSAVRDHLGLSRARFARLRLHELADRIDEFGGPFQTVLLINTYQYLFFGCERYPQCYADHEVIFDCIRRVCGGRVIFNNRTNIEDCQRYVKASARQSGLADTYNTPAALAAARRFFDVSIVGRLGRYPFWVLTPRASAPAATGDANAGAAPFSNRR